MKEAEQHALDRALHEVVGGAAPPDHTFRIVNAVRTARGRRDQEPVGARRNRWVGLLCGAAAAALLTIALWPTSTPAPNLELLVRTGELTWRQGHRELRGRARQFVSVTPQIGDRVLAHRLQPTKLDIASFGTLELSFGTELEILDMEWKEFGIGFGTGTITVGILAGAITWLAGDSVTTATAGETSKLAMGNPGTARGESTTRERELIEQLDAAKKQLEEMRTDAARTPIEKRPDDPDPTIEEKDDEFEPLADYPELRELFEKADWRGVATSTLELTKVAREMFDLLASGEELPREVRGEIRRIEGILHKYGALVEDNEAIQGMTFETKVRHPIVAANWLTACLHGAEKPLDAGQRKMLSDLANRYTNEDAQRRAAYSEDVSDVERYLDEMEMQDRFFTDTRSVLSKDQIDLLYPGKWKGRAAATPIGEGSAAWHDWVQAPEFATKSDFADAMTGGWSRGLGLKGDQKQVMRRIMQQWIEEFPEDLWQRKKDQLARYSFHEVERVRKSARLQLKFFERLNASLKLTPKQRTFLRKIHTIIVPYRK